LMADMRARLIANTARPGDIPHSATIAGSVARLMAKTATTGDVPHSGTNKTADTFARKVSVAATPGDEADIATIAGIVARPITTAAAVGADGEAAYITRKLADATLLVARLGTGLRHGQGEVSVRLGLAVQAIDDLLARRRGGIG